MLLYVCANKTTLKKKNLTACAETQPQPHPYLFGWTGTPTASHTDHPTPVLDLTDALDGNESLQPGNKTCWKTWNQRLDCRLMPIEGHVQSPHISVMAWCPHTFSYAVYFYNIHIVNCLLSCPNCKNSDLPPELKSCQGLKAQIIYYMCNWFPLTTKDAKHVNVLIKCLPDCFLLFSAAVNPMLWLYLCTLCCVHVPILFSNSASGVLQEIAEWGPPVQASEVRLFELGLMVLLSDSWCLCFWCSWFIILC